MIGALPFIVKDPVLSETSVQGRKNINFDVSESQKKTHATGHSVYNRPQGTGSQAN